MKLLSRLILVVFTIFVFLNILQASQWPEDLLKKVEELKMAAKEKKDMPSSLPGIKNIGAEELKRWMDQKKKFVLLDNRLRIDFEKEHIKGAELLTVDDLIKNPQIADKYNKEDIIVVYCNGVKCWRSPAAALLLQHLGFKNIYWYREGIPDWIKRGYPTE